MNNEIATKPVGVLAEYHAPQEEVLKSDILIPYMTLVQDLSDLKKDGLAQPGDICRNKTGEKYGDEKTPVDLVFLHYPKSNWVYQEKQPGSQRFEYRKTVPRDGSNENLAWEYWGDMDGNELAPGTRGASQWRRVKQLAVFALPLKDIEGFGNELKKLETGELPDPSKALTPFMVSFQGSSFSAGKEVCTFFMAAKSMNVPIWRYALAVGCKHTKDDKVSYHSFTVNRAKPMPVPKEFVKTVQSWVEIVSTRQVITEEPPVVEEKEVQPLRNYAPQS